MPIQPLLYKGNLQACSRSNHFQREHHQPQLITNLNMLCAFEQSSVQYKSLLVILLLQFKVNVSLPQNLWHIKDWLIDGQLKNSTRPRNIVDILLHQSKLLIEMSTNKNFISEYLAN